MKRILSAVFAALILLTVVLSAAGCGRVTTLLEVDPTAEERKVVGKVGEHDIYYDELRYITMTYKDQMEVAYGEGIWDDAESAAPYIDELYEKVYNALTANYAVIDLAKENGISLNDSAVQDYCYLQFEDLAHVLQLMLIETHENEKGNNNNTETTNTEAADDGEEETTAAATEAEDDYVPSFEEINELYRDQLENNYLTDRYVRFMYSVDGCVEQLIIKYTEDGKIRESENDIINYIKANFCRTLHVYIRNDVGESVENNRKAAEDVLTELEGGKSFNKMVGSSYNDDLWTTTVNGNYFGRGEMIAEYEDAAFALEVGEYSGIVETESGFYIIKRLPIEESYIIDNYNQLSAQYKYAVVNADIAKKREGLSFVANDFGSSLPLWSME